MSESTVSEAARKAADEIMDSVSELDKASSSFEGRRLWTAKVIQSAIDSEAARVEPWTLVCRALHFNIMCRDEIIYEGISSLKAGLKLVERHNASCAPKRESEFKDTTQTAKGMPRNETGEAHALLNDLGVPNVDSSAKARGRFLTLVERIKILRAQI
jgi:hypothetical protein